MKPIYKILIVVGIIIFVILGIYFGWRAITAEPAITKEPTPPETPPRVNAVPLKKLSEEKVFDFWVNPDTKEIFYFTSDGRVFSAKEGPDLEISKQTISALNFIEVGPKNQKILAAFGNPKSPQWGIFDTIDKVWRPLPSEITNAAWGADDEKLIVILKNGDVLSLAEANITRVPPSYNTLIRDFRLKDIKMTLVSEDRLIISELPSSIYEGRVWQLDLKSLNFNLLIDSEKGFNINWSNDKNLAFAHGLTSGFLILDNNLQIKTPVPFINTLPQKCASDSSKIYCFAPQNISSDIALPDDYLLKKFYSIDDLFVLEIESGELIGFLESNTADVSAIDAKNPQVLGSKLYFINRYDNQLYELNL